MAAEQAPRDGTAPISREEALTLANLQAAGGFTCVRTPESVDGPYYYESSLLRRSLTEGHEGVKLRLGISVGGLFTEGPPCMPLGGAVVDVWFANAHGIYSNVGADLQAEDTIGQTFLRGHQITDDAGYAEFDVIVPGCEAVEAPPPINVVVRPPHIHVKVFHEHKVVTTQLYFPDDYIDELFANVEPYRSHQQLTAPGLDRSYARIHNTEDGGFNFDQSRPMAIEREGDGIFTRAVIGVVTLGGRGFASFKR